MYMLCRMKRRRSRGGAGQARSGPGGLRSPVRTAPTAALPFSTERAISGADVGRPWSGRGGDAVHRPPALPSRAPPNGPRTLPEELPVRHGRGLHQTTPRQSFT